MCVCVCVCVYIYIPYYLSECFDGGISQGLIDGRSKASKEKLSWFNLFGMFNP